jgi:hypothetical protein
VRNVRWREVLLRACVFRLTNMHCTIQQVVDIIRCYHDAHWRKMGVNETCSELKGAFLNLADKEQRA